MKLIDKITSAGFLGGVPGKAGRPTGEKVNGIIDTVNNFVSYGLVVAKGIVTQITSISTAVTTSGSAGVITTVSSTLAAGASASFTVTNALATTGSVIGLTIDGSSSTGTAIVSVKNVANGSFQVTITNVHATAAFNNVIRIHYTIN